MKDSHNGNFGTLRKETEDWQKERHPTLLKMTCTFNAVSIRIPMIFFIEHGEGIPKIQMKIETPIPKTILSQKNNVGWRYHVIPGLKL